MTVGETLIIIITLAAGGLWWLRSRRPSAAAAPIVHGDGKTPLEAVGTSHYRSALDRLFAGVRAEAGDSEIEPGDFTTADVAATLRLTSSNPRDDQAVEVLLTGVHVAHLSAAMARAFRAYVKRQGLRGSEFRCPATVEVPLHHSDDYVITLDLPRLMTPKGAN